YLYAEKLNDLEKGHDAARRARQLAPNDPSCADTLGWILHRRGDYQAALVLLQESAQKLSEEPEVQFHLGMTYYMLGEAERARGALERALTLADTKQKTFGGLDEVRRRLGVLDLNPLAANAELIARLEQQVANEQKE